MNTTTLQNVLDATQAAAAWRPAPGDTIIGELADVGERDNGYGPYPILTLLTDDGAISVHCFHEVLRSELAKLSPQVGECIGIKYIGRHPEKSYHQYRVSVERPGGSVVDWSRYGDAGLDDQQRAWSEDSDGRYSATTPVTLEGAQAPQVAAKGSDDDIPF
jgi:hypothetical protein